MKRAHLGKAAGTRSGTKSASCLCRAPGRGRYSLTTHAFFFFFFSHLFLGTDGEGEQLESPPSSSSPTARPARTPGARLHLATRRGMAGRQYGPEQPGGSGGGAPRPARALRCQAAAAEPRLPLPACSHQHPRGRSRLVSDRRNGGRASGRAEARLRRVPRGTSTPAGRAPPTPCAPGLSSGPGCGTARHGPARHGMARPGTARRGSPGWRGGARPEPRRRSSEVRMGRERLQGVPCAMMSPDQYFRGECPPRPIPAMKRALYWSWMRPNRSG